MNKDRKDIGLIYFADGTVESIEEYVCEEDVMFFKGISGNLFKYRPANKGRVGKFYERKLLITKVNDDGTCDYDISWIPCEIEYVKLK